MTNGLALGVVATIVALLTGKTAMFGLLVFLAMSGLVAGFAGAAIPLLLKRFNIDPAIASSIFVTAFTDVCGFTLFGLGGMMCCWRDERKGARAQGRKVVRSDFASLRLCVVPPYFQHGSRFAHH